MRASVSAGFLLFLFIILALSLLVMSLPIILKAIGMPQWGELIEKLQNIEKYKGEGVTLTLPHYIDRIEFINGYNNKHWN